MIIAQYQKLKKAPWSKNLEIWLHSWEKTYKDTLVTTKGKRLGTYTHSVPQCRDKATRPG